MGGWAGHRTCLHEVAKRKIPIPAGNMLFDIIKDTTAYKKK
jgi:hypothetical protein